MQSLSINTESIVLDTNIWIFGLRKKFFSLIYLYPDQIELSWDKAQKRLIQKYQNLGCKLGDAAVAAHLDMMDIKILISENRDFLEEIQGLPFKIFRAKDYLNNMDLCHK